MTAAQLELLTIYLQSAYTWAREHGYDPIFHHGDCVGSDDQAARTAKMLGFFIIAHPPSNPKKRAWCATNDEVLPEKGYLLRNHDIVDVALYVVATPKGPEEMRSGTWATIRYSQQKNKIPYVIMP
jgi:hypothetical protein